MEEERIFFVDNMHFSNLAVLFEEQGRYFESRSCELAFMADEIIKTADGLIVDGMTVYEILTLLSEEFAADENSNKEEIVKESSVCDMRACRSGISSFDKVMFCRILAEKFKARGYMIDESIFLEEDSGEETFGYVKNSLSDEAYDVFSQEFSDPRVTYYDSFRDACFSVADEKIGYCILPLEEKAGLRIPGIANLISSLDLKIVALTPVFGFEGTADVKYALLGRGFKIPEREGDTDRYLEIRISSDSDMTVSKILSAAEDFGLSVYKIGTMMSPEQDSASKSYSVVLKDGGDSFAIFLLFLTLFERGYTPVGIYKNLE